MLLLEKNQVCPYGNGCPYNKRGECWGARPDRDNTFTCEYVQNNRIVEGGFRNPHDKTGKMTILNG